MRWDTAPLKYIAVSFEIEEEKVARADNAPFP